MQMFQSDCQKNCGSGIHQMTKTSLNLKESRDDGVIKIWKHLQEKTQLLVYPPIYNQLTCKSSDVITTTLKRILC